MVEADRSRSPAGGKADEIRPFVAEVVTDENVAVISDTVDDDAEDRLVGKALLGSGKGPFFAVGIGKQGIGNEMPQEIIAASDKRLVAEQRTLDIGERDIVEMIVKRSFRSIWRANPVAFGSAPSGKLRSSIDRPMIAGRSSFWSATRDLPILMRPSSPRPLMLVITSASRVRRIGKLASKLWSKAATSVRVSSTAGPFRSSMRRMVASASSRASAKLGTSTATNVGRTPRGIASRSRGRAKLRMNAAVGACPTPSKSMIAPTQATIA